MTSRRSSDAGAPAGPHLSMIRGIEMRHMHRYVIAVLLLLGCSESQPPLQVQSRTNPASGPAPQVSPPTEHQSMPALGALADAWNTIRPGGDTTCLYGTEYGFFVRPGATNQALITFPGGGACWSGQTCSDEPQGRMDDNPKTVRAEDNPSGWGGVFADDNPENPFVGFTKVHLGYCTGDMHVGNAVRSNEGWIGEGAPPSETLHFNGFRNASTVLDWVHRNLPDLQTIVVGGYTSGSFGTPLFVSLLADHYPQAAVRHIGDGNGALFIGDRLSALVEAWDTAGVLANQPGFSDIATDTLSFEDITVAAARRHPEIVFTQMITAHDQTFSELIEFLGVEEPILQVVEAGHRYVKDRVANYRTFIAGGNRHVIGLGYFDAIAPTGNRNRGLPEIYDRFYSYQVNGRRYRDWVADIVAGRPVTDVRCTDCSQVEYYTGP